MSHLMKVLILFADLQLLAGETGAYFNEKTQYCKHLEILDLTISAYILNRTGP